MPAGEAVSRADCPPEGQRQQAPRHASRRRSQDVSAHADRTAPDEHGVPGAGRRRRRERLVVLPRVRRQPGQRLYNPRVVLPREPREELTSDPIPPVRDRPV